jgi:serine/threonine-protein kinase
MARFRREAEAFARLHHPNIVQVFDYGERGGQPYFVMELVQGGTLAQRYAEELPPPWEAAALVATVARAIHYAHQRGVVHCALKPESILLTPEGEPKVARLGLARLLGEGGDEVGRGGNVVRLASYMPPEQVEGREVGPAADVSAWGLSCTGR